MLWAVFFIKVVCALLDAGAKIEAKNSGGLTPLFDACLPGKLDVLCKLLERGADTGARTTYLGMTALHFASANERPGSIRELLWHMKEGLDARDDLGRSPLLVGCREGNLLATITLIKFHANLAAFDNDGHSALWHAEWRVAQDALPPAAGAAPVSAEARAEHAAVVALLKVHGAP